MSEPLPALASPADIARATLRHMALHRMPPTPENYAAAWSLVGGASDPKTLPMIHAELAVPPRRGASPAVGRRRMAPAVRRSRRRRPKPSATPTAGRA